MRTIRFFVVAILCLMPCIPSYSMPNEVSRSPVSCPDCSQLFTLRTNMIRHRKAQHEGKWYQCTYKSFCNSCFIACTYRCKDSTRAKEHVIDSHGVSLPEARDYLRIVYDDHARLYVLSAVCVLVKRSQK